MRVCVAFALLFALSVYAEERTATDVSRDAKAAYDRKDYPAYLTEMRTLATMRAGNPIVLVNLGGALALNGRAHGIAVRRQWHEGDPSSALRALYELRTSFTGNREHRLHGSGGNRCRGAEDLWTTELS